VNYRSGIFVPCPSVKKKKLSLRHPPEIRELTGGFEQATKDFESLQGSEKTIGGEGQRGNRWNKSSIKKPQQRY